MRTPLTDFPFHPRDERKHILFLCDLFMDSQDMLLTPLVESLKQEYYCMHAPFPMAHAKQWLCAKVSKSI